MALLTAMSILIRWRPQAPKLWTASHRPVSFDTSFAALSRTEMALLLRFLEFILFTMLATALAVCLVLLFAGAVTVGCRRPEHNAPVMITSVKCGRGRLGDHGPTQPEQQSDRSSENMSVSAKRRA
jgi:hypothetical protein